MLCTTRKVLYNRACCSQRQQDHLLTVVLTREITSQVHKAASLRRSDGSSTAEQTENGSEDVEKREPGAMSRRLEEMTERGLEESGIRAEKMVGEAGFSEELKSKLEARITDSKFRNENPSAFATLDMPV